MHVIIITILGFKGSFFVKKKMQLPKVNTMIKLRYTVDDNTLYIVHCSQDHCCETTECTLNFSGSL